MAKGLTRSVVAKKLGINPETLRYYEEQKLIPKPMRLSNDYRVYSEKEVDQIRFILMAKKLGFSLKEIKDLFVLTQIEDVDREKVRMLAEIKSQEIQEKLSQFTKMRSMLDDLILQCRQAVQLDPCPIVSCLRDKK